MSEESRKGYNWFWNNYNTCMNWVQKHEVAYWKSQALSLQIENENMYKILRNRGYNRRVRFNKKYSWRRKTTETFDNDDCDLNFELTPEWTQYFKESIKHKQKLKEERELKKELEATFLPPQESIDLRQKEMLELYGEGSSMILGMETAMNLSFERYIDRNSPEYWPPLPLNLSAA